VKAVSRGCKKKAPRTTVGFTKKKKKREKLGKKTQKKLSLGTPHPLHFEKKRKKKDGQGEHRSPRRGEKMSRKGFWRDTKERPLKKGPKKGGPGGDG